MGIRIFLDSLIVYIHVHVDVSATVAVLIAVRTEDIIAIITLQKRISLSNYLTFRKIFRATCAMHTPAEIIAGCVMPIKHR